eukprot:365425-Chlamydomonas_euryale.AAC.16
MARNSCALGLGSGPQHTAGAPLPLYGVTLQRHLSGCCTVLLFKASSGSKRLANAASCPATGKRGQAALTGGPQPPSTPSPHSAARNVTTLTLPSLVR